MSGFLKTLQWSWARAPQKRESWGLDRNWHRSEAARHLKSGNLADAERHLTLAVRDADDRGVAPTQRAELRLELAALQRNLAAPQHETTAEDADQLDLAKLRDAENTLREAVIVCTQASDSRLYLRSLDALAEIFCLVEDYPALERVASDAIRLAASISNENPQRMEDRLHWLAMAQDKNGRFPDALKTFDQAITFREKRYGAGHVKTGNLLSEIGRICRARGYHPQAQVYLKVALRIHEAQCGADSTEALGDVRELAGLLEEIGDLDGATALYERILGLQPGSKNLEEVAWMQYCLACLAIGWGGYERARELLTECIVVLEQTGGSRLAVAYESLAHVEEQEGRISFALDELAKATEVWEACDPPQLAELARNLGLRAELSEQLRLHVDANHLRKRARHIAAAAEDQATADETQTIETPVIETIETQTI
jgi:tetratricopeptide (TPR) repeat protein